MHLYKRLLSFLKPHTWIFIAGMLFIGLNTLTEGISLGMLVPLSDIVLAGKPIVVNKEIPLFLGKFIDYLNAMPRLGLLNMMAASVMILVLFKGIARYGQEYFMQNLGHRVVRDIRNTLFEKYHNLSLDFFVKNKTGHLASRVLYDSSTVQNSLSQALSDLVWQSFRVILFMSVVFVINWKLSLFVFIMAPFIALSIVRLGRTVRKVSKWAQEKMGDISSTLYETLSGARIIKAFGMENYEIEKFKSFNQRFFKINLKRIKRIEAISPISEFFGTIVAVIVLSVGGRIVIQGNLSLGVFVLYLGSLMSLVRPINRLARIHGVNQNALAAAERIFEMLDLEASVKDYPEAVELKEYKNDIKYENIKFSYDEDSPDILENVNFKITKGEIIAIVGPTGAGKTTLVNLLPRFYDPTEGKVLIDGKNIKDFTLSSLRSKISLVTQDTILFNDTVGENIAYGKKHASKEEIILAAKMAFAHNFIKKLPQGYDTIIGDRGVRLSGGEKQRISIARAVLRDAPILILDEATSQLDTASEDIVKRAINKLIEKKTVLVIAHRLTTVKKASRILVLENGRIIQSGTHKELMNVDGLYKKLYSLQFSEADMEN